MCVCLCTQLHIHVHAHVLAKVLIVALAALELLFDLIWLGTHEPPASVSWVLSSLPVYLTAFISGKYLTSLSQRDSTKAMSNKQCPSLYRGFWEYGFLMALWHSFHNWSTCDKWEAFSKQCLDVLRSYIEQEELLLWPSTNSMVLQGSCTCEVQGTGPELLIPWKSSLNAEQQSPVLLQILIWPMVLQRGVLYGSDDPHYSSHLISMICVLKRKGLWLQIWNDWKLCMPFELLTSIVLKGPLFTLVHCCARVTFLSCLSYLFLYLPTFQNLTSLNCVACVNKH